MIELDVACRTATNEAWEAFWHGVYGGFNFRPRPETQARMDALEAAIREPLEAEIRALQARLDESVGNAEKSVPPNTDWRRRPNEGAGGG